eukprot:1192973-Rhodomonas_salina.5
MHANKQYKSSMLRCTERRDRGLLGLVWQPGMQLSPLCVSGGKGFADLYAPVSNSPSPSLFVNSVCLVCLFVRVSNLASHTSKSQRLPAPSALSPMQSHSEGTAQTRDDTRHDGSGERYHAYSPRLTRTTELFAAPRTALSIVAASLGTCTTSPPLPSSLPPSAIGVQRRRNTEG